MNLTGQVLSSIDFPSGDFELTEEIETCNNCELIVDVDAWLSGDLGLVDFSEFSYDWLSTTNWNVFNAGDTYDLQIPYPDNSWDTYTKSYQVTDESFAITNYINYSVDSIDFNPDWGFAYVEENFTWLGYEQGRPLVPFGIEAGDSYTCTHDMIDGTSEILTYIYPDSTVVDEMTVEIVGTTTTTLTFLGLIDIYDYDGVYHDLVVIKSETESQWEFGATVGNAKYRLYAPNNLMFPCFTISATADSTIGVKRFAYSGLPNHTLSIEDNRINSSISIFPNPSTDRINISTTSRKDLFILNSFGELITILKNQNTQFELDISNFSAGLYILTDMRGNSFQFLKK